MAPFACGTRDRPFPCLRLPPPLTRCGLSGLIKKLRSPHGRSVACHANRGNCVPEFTSGVGCTFRLRACWESASHFKSKFRDTVSGQGVKRKVYPSLSADSGTHFPKPCPSGKPVPRSIHPADAGERVFQDGLVIGVMENVAPHACHGCSRECQEKSLEDFEAFASVLFRTRGSDRPTRPARPSWRLPPCCPDLPWSDGPSRQPSCRAAS